MTIRPGETFEYRVLLDVHKPGPFESNIVLFLEDRGIREVEISVRGICVGGTDGTDQP